MPGWGHFLTWAHTPEGRLVAVRAAAAADPRRRAVLLASSEGPRGPRRHATGGSGADTGRRLTASRLRLAAAAALVAAAAGVGPACRDRAPFTSSATATGTFATRVACSAGTGYPAAVVALGPDLLLPVRRGGRGRRRSPTRRATATPAIVRQSSPAPATAPPVDVRGGRHRADLVRHDERHDVRVDAGPATERQLRGVADAHGRT